MRLAYLSPLPPVRSGVSEYSADLLPALNQVAPVKVFAGAPAVGPIGGLPVAPPEEFDREHGRFDLAIYHMGNNVHHRFVAERAERWPGLLVLHDLVLHHFYVEETLAKGRPDEYLSLMEEAYGELGRGAALSRLHDIASQLEYFTFPLFERLCSRSRGVLVHNRRAQRMIRERIGGIPVEVVPMGIPHAAADRLPPGEEARRELGVGADEFVVGLFGFMTPIKRPDAALRAFAAALPRIPQARLVVVGEFASWIDLDRQAQDLGIAERVTLTGYIPYRDVKRWVAATDVFLNLRYPTAGETSASLLRLLGWGKTVVVSDYAQFREIPESAAVRVSLGPSEEAELVAVLEVLHAKPGLRQELGTGAASFISREHTVEGAARVYAGLARELTLRGPVAGHMLPLNRERTTRTPRYPAVAVQAEPLPRRVPPGARLTLRARLRNTGDTTWLRWWASQAGYATFGVFLWGEHLGPDFGPRLWRGKRGPHRELAATALPRDVKPGEEVDVSVTFRIPEKVGLLELVADVRIMGWGWLHQRGSPAMVYQLEVTE